MVAGKIVGALFIDFRKAFDSVSHDMLYYKMHTCGISGPLINWMLSYLAGRGQFVELNATKAPVLQVRYSVTQGSLQGPRHLSIYVNNFPDCVSEGEIHLYADDTTAYVIGNSVDCSRNSALVLLFFWEKQNPVTFHVVSVGVLLAILVLFLCKGVSSAVQVLIMSKA